MKDTINVGGEKGKLNTSTMGKSTIGDLSVVPNQINKLLDTTINLNDGIRPNTSDAKIQGKADFIADNFDSIPGGKIASEFLSMGFPQFIDDFSKICMGVKNGNEILERLQEMTSSFKMKDNIEYTKLIMNSLAEYNKKIGIDQPSHKNDIIYCFMYLLYETMSEKYNSEFGDYFRTDEQEEQFTKMKERAKTLKIN